LRAGVIDWLRRLDFRPELFIEPFAGGASIGLAVAELGLADKVILVERDPDVAAVWRAILGDKARGLRNRIRDFSIGRNAVKRALSSTRKDLLSVAFRCLLRNRVSRAGILAPGAGLLRQGEAGRGIGSRWYAETLQRRIERVQALANCIRFLEEDAFTVIPHYINNPKAVWFVDPPYLANGEGPGRRLYRYSDVNHGRLLELLAAAAGPAMITYHDSTEIRYLARRHGYKLRSVWMRGAHDRRTELVLTRA
jgi:DNA adenine methylase